MVSKKLFFNNNLYLFLNRESISGMNSPHRGFWRDATLTSERKPRERKKSL